MKSLPHKHSQLKATATTIKTRKKNFLVHCGFELRAFFMLDKQVVYHLSHGRKLTAKRQQKTQ
jgi:hypothetical protein